MAVVSYTKALDALLTNTQEKVMPTMADNIFKGNPVTAKLWDRRETVEGGESIQYPLMYGKNTTVKWASGGYDTFDLTAQEGMTRGIFNWKTMFLSTSISGDERRKNSGTPAVLNLWNQKLQQTEKTARETLNIEICQVSTSKDPNSVLGLDNIVTDDTAFADTLGSINAATNTWWRNQQFDPEAATKWARFLSNLHILCSEGTEKPDLAVTTKTAYASLETVMSGQIRVTSKEFDDLGFENIAWKRMAIVPDHFLQTGKFYMLNTKWLRLVVHPEGNFAGGKVMEIVNQDAFVSKIIFMGQLLTNNRRYHGVNVTTAVPDGTAVWV